MNVKVSDVFDEWARVGRAEGMEQGHAFAVHAVLDGLVFEKPYRFLDFGCGNGWVVRKMAGHALCEEAWGIDVSKEMIVRAKNRRKSPKEHYECASIQTWATSLSFDLIFSMEALYYSVPMEPSFDRLASLLSPGGQIIIATDFYYENISSHSWPDDVGISMDLRSKDEWRALFVKTGLRNVEQRQVLYPELAEEKLEQDVHGTARQPSWKQKMGTLVTLGFS